LWWDESIDASGDARLSADAATPFEAADPLIGCRRGDAEMALYVCAQSEGRLELDEMNPKSSGRQTTIRFKK
jgi:hypothetical protein